MKVKVVFSYAEMTPRKEPVPDLDSTALDRGRLRARALHVIERLWGKDAKKRDLLEPNAYARLRQTHGVGEGCIAEIERAVIAWGFDGIGGKRALDEAHRRRLMHRTRLNAALRDLGVRQTIELLADLCSEHVAAHVQRSTHRPSKLRRAKSQRAVSYYGDWRLALQRCVDGAPVAQITEETFCRVRRWSA